MSKLGRDGTAGSSTGGSRASIAGGKGRLGVSTRTSQIDSGTKRMVKKQNKAAESYKIKDMDAMDMNKIRYQASLKKKAAELKAAKVSGFKAGAAAGGATVGSAAIGVAVVKKDKKKPSTKNK
jgi:hypothetical protein